MGLVEVGVGQGEVAADHVEGGVAEAALEGEGVPPVSQEHDGEGMAESVDVGVRDAGPLADAAEEAAEDGRVCPRRW